MVLTSPLWLWLLIPWGAVVVWTMWGRRNRVAVPFLALWRDNAVSIPKSRAFTLPPIAVILILASIFLTIAAAAGPAKRGRPTFDVVLLIDRGVTMSGGSGEPRFRLLANAIAEKLEHQNSARIAGVDVIPKSQRAIHSDTWAKALREVEPTAVDTTELLTAAAARALAIHPEAIVILASDRRVDIRNDRLQQIAPPSELDNVSIIRVASRWHPKPQVMIQLRNDSLRTSVECEVASGDQQVTRLVELPKRGASLNVFVDLPSLGDRIAVVLKLRDDVSADNVAYLARQAAWPRVELRGGLPAEVGRVVGAFRIARPAANGARTITVSTPETREVDEPTAIVANGGQIVASSRAEPTVVEHALTRDLDWRRAVRGAKLTEAPAGMSPLVSIDGRVYIAVSTGKIRRVWVGVDSPSFAGNVDFVVFWTNVLDWLGASSQDSAAGFSSEPAQLLDEAWVPEASSNSTSEPGYRPGIYKRSDGAIRAIHSASVPNSSLVASTGTPIDRMLAGHDDLMRLSSVPLAPPLAILAGIGLMAAAWTWCRNDASNLAMGRTTQLRQAQ